MTQSLNLVFCGTPRFAVPTLERLVAAGHRIHLVVTQPDRPKGRGLGLVASPVKESALKLNLPITQPDRIKTNDEFRAQLTALKPDAIIVVGYGRIIPQWMLDLPPLGNINLHASLLPKYRGAAPIQWAIANGETVTGNTTMRIDSGLDTGEILLQKELTIANDDTAETLAPPLAAMGAVLVEETLAGLQSGTIHPRKQDNRDATLAPILKKEDGLVDFSRTATEICNRLRGFQPWPGAHTKFRGKNLQILNAHPTHEGVPPSELRVFGDRLLLGCGQNTSVELLELQLEGKKRSTAQSFINGYHPTHSEKLGIV
ncbi:MAG TPA: methionyl-tRNA formyltransferase [Candidatus Dormibacteraeota bacterium]|nr:methionyl-tRNA formyltransferase [Candidatus Dormibacteraeota bacterium]